MWQGRTQGRTLRCVQLRAPERKRSCARAITFSNACSHAVPWKLFGVQADSNPQTCWNPEPLNPKRNAIPELRSLNSLSIARKKLSQIVNSNFFNYSRSDLGTGFRAGGPGVQRRALPHCVSCSVRTGCPLCPHLQGPPSVRWASLKHLQSPSKSIWVTPYTPTTYHGQSAAEVPPRPQNQPINPSPIGSRPVWHDPFVCPGGIFLMIMLNLIMLGTMAPEAFHVRLHEIRFGAT